MDEKKGRNLKMLSEEWENLTELVVWGFGKLADGNIDSLISEFKINYIIDNAQELRGKEYREIKIISYEEWLALEKKDKIVVCVYPRVYKKITAELKERGFVEYRDFCDLTCFLIDYFWNYLKKAYVGQIVVPMTTRCTLNCEKCLVFTPYNHDKKDYDLELLKRDIDLLFQNIDYVSKLIVTGGEPQMNRHLGQYLDYVGKEYSDKIGNIEMVTNGTLLPSEELMGIIAKNQIEVRVSDYTSGVGSINYAACLNKLCSLLEVGGGGRYDMLFTSRTNG